MNKFALFIILAMVLTLVIACGGISTNVTSNNPNTVKLEGQSFATSSITISKGSTITFLDDPNNGALHILVIGQDGQQESEQGAPDFGGAAGQRVDIGDTWTTPPWNTAGTYHVACTVHPAMNLTVTVKG
ncbi:MAG TPA: plastocyanin/azurin family copper-binding protein [Ktedonobacteraceae bacterium]|nr:plastocyanin/azurin family copper-binding protein [Ktedonobacteraceae bacterium]